TGRTVRSLEKYRLCEKSPRTGRQASSPVMADRLPACRLHARQAGGPPAVTAGTAVFRRTRTFHTVSIVPGFNPAERRCRYLPSVKNGAAFLTYEARLFSHRCHRC